MRPSTIAPLLLVLAGCSTHRPGLTSYGPDVQTPGEAETLAADLDADGWRMPTETRSFTKGFEQFGPFAILGGDLTTPTCLPAQDGDDRPPPAGPQDDPTTTVFEAADLGCDGAFYDPKAIWTKLVARAEQAGQRVSEADDRAAALEALVRVAPERDPTSSLPGLGAGATAARMAARAEGWGRVLLLDGASTGGGELRLDGSLLMPGEVEVLAGLHILQRKGADSVITAWLEVAADRTTILAAPEDLWDRIAGLGDGPKRLTVQKVDAVEAAVEDSPEDREDIAVTARRLLARGLGLAPGELWVLMRDIVPWEVDTDSGAARPQTNSGQAAFGLGVGWGWMGSLQNHAQLTPATAARLGVRASPSVAGAALSGESLRTRLCAVTPSDPHHMALIRATVEFGGVLSDQDFVPLHFFLSGGVGISGPTNPWDASTTWNPVGSGCASTGKPAGADEGGPRTLLSAQGEVGVRLERPTGRVRPGLFLAVDAAIPGSRVLQVVADAAPDAAWGPTFVTLSPAYIGGRVGGAVAIRVGRRLWFRVEGGVGVKFTVANDVVVLGVPDTALLAKLLVRLPRSRQ